MMNWDDMNWCDRHVKPADLSDRELLEAAAKVHDYSVALSDLIAAAVRRKLPDILPIARRHIDHPDPFTAGEAAEAIAAFGDPSDLPALLTVVPHAVDHYQLATVLNAALAVDPSRVDEVLRLTTAELQRDAGDDFDADYVMAAVLSRVAELAPDNWSRLEEHLLAAAVDRRLTPPQRERVFRRLVRVPRTERVEKFLVDFIIRDDRAETDLSKIVDDALREDV